MRVRFYTDPDTGRPHIEGHNVTEAEARQVLRNADQDYDGREGTRNAAGQTDAGRYLRVIYRREDDGETLFVITAFDVPPKAKKVLRRKRRRRS
jgi:hypothetical protein